MELIIHSPNNPIFCQIFDLTIRWYGIFLTIALFFGVLLSYFLIKKRYHEKDADAFLDVSPFLILFSIIGARFFYVVGDWEFYSKNLNEIFLINHGGISIYGGIIFGLIFSVTYSFFKKINPLKYLDIFAIALPLAQSVGRWGNFFNQEAYGKPSNCFLKLYISPENRLSQYKNIDFYHPVFLYESILDFVVFMTLLTLFLKFKNLKKGVLTCLYLIAYAIIRFFLEYIRTDSVLDCFGLHVAQVISLGFVVVSLITLILINKKGG